VYPLGAQQQQQQQPEQRRLARHANVR
jgi:hypothetical protein